MKSEFELIKSIAAKSEIRNPKSEIRAGIGDDCAVIGQNGKFDLVITTDLLIEDVDFRLSWTTPEFVGHKALAVSLSDAAAMGAKPVWALISIGVPAQLWATDFVERFYDGWFALAGKFNVALVGGDVSRAPDKLVIDSIVAANVPKNRAVLRSGARVGDSIFVTGSLGGAAAGLRLLEQNLNRAPNQFENLLIKRQLRPTPRVKTGLRLGKHRLATAMIDLSDGLSSDLRHLCRMSGVGARIFADQIPVDENLHNIGYSKSDALALALDGGEDFELLLTSARENSDKIRASFPEISCIGEIVDRDNAITQVDGTIEIALKSSGFRHF